MGLAAAPPGRLTGRLPAVASRPFRILLLGVFWRLHLRAISTTDGALRPREDAAASHTV